MYRKSCFDTSNFGEGKAKKGQYSELCLLSLDLQLGLINQAVNSTSYSQQPSRERTGWQYKLNMTKTKLLLPAPENPILSFGSLPTFPATPQFPLLVTPLMIPFCLMALNTTHILASPNFIFLADFPPLNSNFLCPVACSNFPLGF